MGRRGKFLSWSRKGVRVGHGRHKAYILGGRKKASCGSIGCTLLVCIVLFILLMLVL